MAITTRIQVGQMVKTRELVTIHSECIRLPDRQRIVHLQFRRFAGCPVCNLHLQSIVTRHEEIVAASIREVVVFHSAVKELLPYTGDLPFAVIADPGKQLYREFGVESAPRALLDPGAWVPVLRGVVRSLGATLRKEQPVPSLNPDDDRFGLPADFLIGSDGRVMACKYGSHVYDQRKVDEILALASEAASAPPQRLTRRIVHLPTKAYQRGGSVDEEAFRSRVLTKEEQ
jgi:peroxiredoxin